MVKKVSLTDMKKRIISLAGFMGSGKSSVGSALAALTGAEFTDLDDLVAVREGRTVTEIFLDGEEAFRRAELDALLAFLDGAEMSGKPAVLALGGGTLCGERARREVLSRTETVYLRTSFPVIRERIGVEDLSRPLFKDAERLFAEREAIYSEAPVAVDTDSLSVAEVAEVIKDIFSA